MLTTDKMVKLLEYEEYIQGQQLNPAQECYLDILKELEMIKELDVIIKAQL